jgi:glycosyltransferase involved in cell wall biosynthesis
MNTPFLSVIIPTYNRAELLPKALESVYNQTFSDFEIVVVDDGSTDRTEESIARFLKNTPTRGNRLRYFYQRNQGKSVALNRGMSEARGEWIAFLDSDDLWLANKLEEQFRALQQYAPQSQACFTDARYINNPALRDTAFEHARKHLPKPTGVITNLSEFAANPFGFLFPTLLASYRVLSEVGEFDPTLQVMEDLDFIFRLALRTKLCFVNAPLTLVDRTPHRSDGLIENLLRNDSRSLRQQQRVYDKWFNLCEGLDGKVKKAVRSHLRSVHSKWANWYLINKQYKEARRALSAALRADLTLGTTAKWCLAAAAPAIARSIAVKRLRLGTEQKEFLAMGCLNPKDSNA